MAAPEHEAAATGWAVKYVPAGGNATGWSAWAGDTYITAFDTAREAREAAGRVIGCSLRWVKDATGVYRGVV
jgi:hypothetical protein